LSAHAGAARPLRSSSSVEAGVRDAIGRRPQAVGGRTLHVVATNAIGRPVQSRDGVRRSPGYVEVRRVLGSHPRRTGNVLPRMPDYAVIVRLSGS
jgi:hypothetical protein